MKICKNCYESFECHKKNLLCDDCVKIVKKCSGCHSYVKKLYTNRKAKSFKKCLSCYLVDIIRYSHTQYDYSNSSEWIECKVCGYRSGDLSQHLKIHNTTARAYKKLFKASTKSEKLCRSIRGTNNPIHSSIGNTSPLSKDYYAYVGLSDSEKELKIAEVNERRLMALKGKRNTSIQYWLDKGYDEEAARKKLSKRQATMSLEKCIERHGEVEGLRIWERHRSNWMTKMGYE